jgi:hypothetical protein
MNKERRRVANEWFWFFVELVVVLILGFRFVLSAYVNGRDHGYKSGYYDGARDITEFIIEKLDSVKKQNSIPYNSK